MNCRVCICIRVRLANRHIIDTIFADGATPERDSERAYRNFYCILFITVRYTNTSKKYQYNQHQTTPILSLIMLYSIDRQLKVIILPSTSSRKSNKYHFSIFQNILTESCI